MNTYWPVRPREQLDVGLDVLGGEGHEVGDHVELLRAQRGADGGRVADVGGEDPHALGQRAHGRAAAVEDVHVEAELDGAARSTRS